MLQPVTVLGELLDVFVDYMALLVLTMPVAIVARNFHDQYESFFRGWDFSDSSWSESDDEDNDLMDDYDVAVMKLSTDDLDTAMASGQDMYPWGKQQWSGEEYEDEEVKMVMPDTPSGSSTMSVPFRKERV